MEPLRGNVETRLRRLEEGACDATILAAAGLRRLGVAPTHAEALDVDVKQVSVKARSNDGLGDAGTGRACEAWLTVLIYPASD